MNRTQDYIREFVTIFFSRLKTIVATFLLVTISVVLFCFLWPKNYEANCSIILKGSISLKNPESIEEIQTDIAAVTETDLYSEMEIITANVVLERTVNNYLQQKNLTVSQNPLSNMTFEQLKNNIRAAVSTTVSPRTNIIWVKLKWENPDDAKLILGILVDNYLKYRSEIYNPREAEVFFKKQLDRFKSALDEKENELLSLIESVDTPNPNSRIAGNMQDERSFGRVYLDFKQKYMEKKFQINLIENDLKSNKMVFFTYVKNDPIADYAKQIQDLIVARNKTLEIFHPNSSKVKRIDERIQELYGMFKQEMGQYLRAEKATLNGIEKNMKMYEDRISTIAQENMRLNKAMAKQKVLNREIKVLEDSYETFTKRLEEARISNNYNTNKLFSVTVLEKPESSQVPTFPNKRKLIPLGVIAGILLGITVGFLLDFFDHSIKRPEDVSTGSKTKYVFSIPE